MKKLVFLSAILSLASAGYPEVQTWSEGALLLSSVLYQDKFFNPDLRQCLQTAQQILSDEYEVMLEDYPDKLKIPVENFGALIPAPSGASEWTVREMMNLLDLVGDTIGLEIDSTEVEYSSTYWSTNRLYKLLATLGIPKTGNIPGELRATREICTIIVLVMSHIKHNINNYDLEKDTFPVYLPAADISIWTLHELNEAISNGDNNSQLVPYLKRARANELQQSEDGTEYCVITPVGLIPKDYPYHFIPKAFKRLVLLSKVEN